MVIGSQSIHGAFPVALLDANLTRSAEIDTIPLHDAGEEKSWALSVRGAAYGTEIDGVALETAALPEGWLDRLIPYPLHDNDPDTVIAWCLDPNDLAVSKAIAGREQDREFLRALHESHLFDPGVALTRLGRLDAACHRPRQMNVDRAIAFLHSLPAPGQVFPPADRQPPKGRHRPTHEDFR